MRVRTFCVAAASVLAAAAGLVVTATPANATGACNGGMGLVAGAGAGVVSPANPFDWYTTTLPAGTYTVVLETLTPLADADLWLAGADCSYPCVSAQGSLDSCDITFSSPATLNIQVSRWTGNTASDVAYALQIVPPGGTSSSSGSCTTIAGHTACGSLTAGTVFDSFTLYGPGVSPAHVAGYVDSYAFTLPNGGVVTAPCVVLVIGTQVNACGTAGGTFVSRLATLVDTTVGLPTGGPTNPLVTVTLCNADLVLTVDGLGINSFPAYTVC